MSEVFADTYFYIALVSIKDRFHSLARQFASSDTLHLVTTEYVLIEIANFFSRAHLKSVFLDIHSDVQGDAKTRVIPASADLLQKGIALYANRTDHDWSLTDCLTFTVMSERSIDTALTADHHFVQAGYQILLR